MPVELSMAFTILPQNRADVSLVKKTSDASVGTQQKLLDERVHAGPQPISNWIIKSLLLTIDYLSRQPSLQRALVQIFGLHVTQTQPGW